MTDLLHKLVFFFASPLTLAFALAGVALLAGVRGRRRPALALAAVALLWTWVWSMPAFGRLVGLPLERAYPALAVEEAEPADLIVVLGGGMDAAPDASPYAEMSAAADRVWHAARLYKAGKAPRVAMLGQRVRETTAPLLRDLGVPDGALVAFDDACNTEEETQRVKDELARAPAGGRVLLVTSAWHMRRAIWLFRRAGIDAIPSATDHAMTVAFAKGHCVADFFPKAEALYDNTRVFKERFAYWCYRLLK